MTGVPTTVVVLPIQEGSTALMVASQWGYEVVVEALLKAGATVDMQGKVLLCWAFYHLIYQQQFII